jgi:hypothetical protein
METTVALSVVAAAVVVGVQAMSGAAQQRRAAAQRAAATLEAANVLEEVMAADWQAVESRAEAMQVSEATARLLPSAELQVALGQPQSLDGAALETLRVTVMVRWKDAAGDWTAPVRLSALRHRIPPNEANEAGAAP